MGKKEEETAQMFIDETQAPLSVEQVIALMDANTEKAFPDVDLLPGADKLVRHLHKHGVHMAIASGSSENQYRMKVTKRHTEFFRLF